MCVFLCANPKVFSLLNAITADSEREVLQATEVCCVTPKIGDMLDRRTLDESEVKKIPRGPMLREGYWPRGNYEDRFSDTSFEAWKNPLDALANAWTRLLVLVGLRR
jgi:hypothetical protein